MRGGIIEIMILFIFVAGFIPIGYEMRSNFKKFQSRYQPPEWTYETELAPIPVRCLNPEKLSIQAEIGCLLK